ncbi:hypothetical protein [endosymbiont GvMRE of Glomus versiforme]|uniref:hypothetical protein n=1 Tax=endosymbiont GvMRE of Glomus versiforme TaxID=2039283 RepID=UPI000EEC5850|nr:hypothetical protein [endosymbiont GvMRE of Glomus versiforme]RHZ35857.1 hypothetical protein GvMRE_Ic4g13 [endosymbiont GvMRE of Glomus versiforme]RHZ35859.1 hypothetical protein GvMRE_Ic4g11 [endosymbiont GvMRE of Glomus versiforme]RHZ36215.1 hypothetical protein GvMRE_Ic2g6 [endosymbiont GvMRE of Glomus versiforme]
MWEKLNRFIKVDFVCDKCQKEFNRKVAYSPDSDLDQLKTTYCGDCVKANEKANNHWNKIHKKSLGAVPQEASQNLQAPELAPSDKRISGRTKQLNLKVKEQTYWKLKEYALKEKCLMTEILEKSLECYGKHRKK